MSNAVLVVHLPLQAGSDIYSDHVAPIWAPFGPTLHQPPLASRVRAAFYDMPDISDESDIAESWRQGAWLVLRYHKREMLGLWHFQRTVGTMVKGSYNRRKKGYSVEKRTAQEAHSRKLSRLPPS